MVFQSRDRRRLNKNPFPSPVRFSTSPRAGVGQFLVAWDFSNHVMVNCKDSPNAHINKHALRLQTITISRTTPSEFNTAVAYISSQSGMTHSLSIYHRDVMQNDTTHPCFPNYTVGEEETLIHQKRKDASFTRGTEVNSFGSIAGQGSGVEEGTPWEGLNKDTLTEEHQCSKHAEMWGIHPLQCSHQSIWRSETELSKVQHYKSRLCPSHWSWRRMDSFILDGQS